MDPHDASAHNNLGVLFYAHNRFTEAKIYFEKALSLEENYTEAQQNLKKSSGNTTKGYSGYFISTTWQIFLP